MTAAFNLNLLERINRELDGTLPIKAFRHRAIWNDDRARIEMHLEATQDMAFTIEGRPSPWPRARRSTPRTATTWPARRPHPATRGRLDADRRMD